MQRVTIFAGGKTVTECCVFFGFHYLQFPLNQLQQETKLNRILEASHSALHNLNYLCPSQNSYFSTMLTDFNAMQLIELTLSNSA